MHGTTLRSGGSLYVHAPMYVSAVVPPAGPVSGGTRVSVIGAGFRHSATLRCRFEGSGATAVARRIGIGQVECASPASSSVGARRLSMSANGQQFAVGEAVFTYRPAAAVSSVWPLRGASEGGTPVTVLGSGFSSAAEAVGALRCRMNATVVAAAYVSESALVCNSTASGSGHVSVEVSTNGREYTSSGVQFEVVSVSVRGIAPWSGPALGGTVVTIAGSRLGQSSDFLQCRFGVSSASLASAHGSDGVRCVSPAALPTGWSSIELSIHGTPLRSGGSLYVHPVLFASELMPPAGPVSGGTRITVLGSGFRESASLRCRFEGSSSTTVARRISSGQLECSSPPSLSSGSRPLALSANGQQFTLSDVSYTYLPAAWRSRRSHCSCAALPRGLAQS